MNFNNVSKLKRSQLRCRHVHVQYDIVNYIRFCFANGSEISLYIYVDSYISCFGTLK